MGLSKQEYCSGLLFLSSEIFLTYGSNPGPLHCRQILYCLSHQGSPKHPFPSLLTYREQRSPTHRHQGYHSGMICSDWCLTTELISQFKTILMALKPGDTLQSPEEGKENTGAKGQPQKFWLSRTRIDPGYHGFLKLRWISCATRVENHQST